MLLQKATNQQRNILNPLAKWRNLDRNHGQPKIKIFAKASASSFRFERFIRGGDRSDVNRNLPGITDLSNVTILEHSQKPGLQLLGHRIDFVQEEGPVIALFEKSDFIHHGAGKRSLFMAEQLRFKQVVREGAAIDRNERMMLPRTVEMERPGH